MNTKFKFLMGGREILNFIVMVSWDGGDLTSIHSHGVLILLEYHGS